MADDPQYAFPVPMKDACFDPGMTLRDYFAGQAMAGTATLDITAADAAEWSYKAADAMLKAREEGT